MAGLVILLFKNQPASRVSLAIFTTRVDLRALCVLGGFVFNLHSSRCRPHFLRPSLALDYG
jgi:hypothetical protein